MKRSFLRAALFVLVLAGTASADVPADSAQSEKPSSAVSPQVGERLLRANAYLEDGKLDDALSVVDELVRFRKAKPIDLAQVHRFRGYILLAKNEHAKAAEEFETALAQDALDDTSKHGMMYSLAQIYTQQSRYADARRIIDQWFETAADPKPEAYFLKAMILVQQDAFADALEPARIAVERSATPHEGWLQLLAAVQFQLQDYAGVASTLEQLLAVSPATKRYWIQLATIENTLGREQSALSTLGVADAGGLLQDDRELRQRARLCFVRELPECCARTMEQGLASGKIKADGEAYQLLANCYIAARDTERALEPLAKAGELSKDAKGYLLLGQLLLQGEEFVAARDALAKALPRSKPEDRAGVELLIGVAELGAKRYDRAEASFRTALASEKMRPAAESYLKHLDQKRALDKLAESATAAREQPGEPVSDASRRGSEKQM